MRALLVGVALLAGSVGGLQQSQDGAVYQAVLEHTLRPQAKKYGIARGVAASAPLLIAAETDTFCTASRPAPVGCVRESTVPVFEGSHPRANTLPFARLIDQRTRERLAHAFRSRNAASAPLTGESLQGAKLVPPAELRALNMRDVAGFSTFSVPAYAGRHALVYTSFTCGGLCGYGWLVLLERHDDGWRVLGNHVMWIS